MNGRFTVLLFVCSVFFYFKLFYLLNSCVIMGIEKRIKKMNLV